MLFDFATEYFDSNRMTINRLCTDYFKVHPICPSKLCSMHGVPDNQIQPTSENLFNSALLKHLIGYSQNQLNYRKSETFAIFWRTPMAHVPRRNFAYDWFIVWALHWSQHIKMKSLQRYAQTHITYSSNLHFMVCNAYPELKSFKTVEYLKSFVIFNAKSGNVASRGA